MIFLELRRMSTGLALMLAALLAACATPQEDRVTRLRLADRSYLEMRLPQGWSIETSFADGRRLSQVRFTTREPGPQMWLAPRLDEKGGSLLNTGRLSEAARLELSAGKDCEGIGSANEERRLDQGTALFCSQVRTGDTVPSRLLPTAAGAIAVPSLVARFAMLGITEAEAADAWFILRSIKVSTIASSP